MRRHARATSVFALLFFGACAVARGAEPIYVEFFDARGVQIAGPVRVRGHVNALEGLAFLHSWSAPFDPISGRPTRGPQMQTLEITVPIGPATPLLLNALTTGDGLDRVVFHFVRVTEAGEEEFYRVTIDHVQFIERTMDLFDILDPNNRSRDLTETYVFAYERAQMESLQSVRQLLYLPGDTNGDLVVDISDAVQLLGYLFLGSQVRCPLSGDINVDDRLDISDGVALLTFLFAGAKPPPPPFPRCGEMPTGKSIPCGLSACETRGQ
jgi:type VI secretion system secreted protein Hcp